jgi:hypothetical protein
MISPGNQTRRRWRMANCVSQIAVRLRSAAVAARPQSESKSCTAGDEELAFDDIERRGFGLWYEGRNRYAAFAQLIAS